MLMNLSKSVFCHGEVGSCLFVWEGKQILQRNAHGFCIMSWPTSLNICTVSIFCSFLKLGCVMLVFGSTVHHSTSRLLNSRLRFPKSILGQVWGLNHSNGHFFEGKYATKMYHKRCHISAHVYNDMFFMILGKPKSGFMSLIIFILYSTYFCCPSFQTRTATSTHTLLKKVQLLQARTLQLPSDWDSTRKAASWMQGPCQPSRGRGSEV